MGFLPEWGAQFPISGSTAMDAPPGYITLYVSFFQEGNFRLPMTRFTTDVLGNYGLHISQINAIGLPRITHFEFVCMANHLDPTFEMFNVFYTVLYTSGFYSFSARTGVALVCYVPLKSLHDWKQKFFYIRRGVIPVDMHYRSMDEVGYTLLNVLDTKVGGAMVEVIQKPEKRPWLDQIGGRFLHPTNESFIAYANTALGEDREDDEDDAFDFIREEVIVLSSDGSGRSFEGLTSCSLCAGPAQGVVHEPVNEPVDDDVEIPVETAEQLETRRKTKAGKPEGKGKRAEEIATETPRKRLHTLRVLDYVVVSDTLSGLGAGEKRPGSDPEDCATLTEMMQKRAFEDKKRKLDEQAAAILASKKIKLQKEDPPAPSESGVDMGVFSSFF
ncbi:hypothetical protein Hdeb2414_s0986g00970981 [Helianthus debilis subsp. tardiflorus]